MEEPVHGEELPRLPDHRRAEAGEEEQLEAGGGALHRKVHRRQRGLGQHQLADQVQVEGEVGEEDDEKEGAENVPVGEGDLHQLGSVVPVEGVQCADSEG